MRYSSFSICLMKSLSAVAGQTTGNSEDQCEHKCKIFKIKSTTQDLYCRQDMLKHLERFI